MNKGHFETSVSLNTNSQSREFVVLIILINRNLLNIPDYKLYFY